MPAQPWNWECKQPVFLKDTARKLQELEGSVGCGFEVMANCGEPSQDGTDSAKTVERFLGPLEKVILPHPCTLGKIPASPQLMEVPIFNTCPLPVWLNQDS